MFSDVFGGGRKWGPFGGGVCVCGGGGGLGGSEVVVVTDPAGMLIFPLLQDLTEGKK